MLNYTYMIHYKEYIDKYMIVYFLRSTFVYVDIYCVGFDLGVSPSEVINILEDNNGDCYFQFKSKEDAERVLDIIVKKVNLRKFFEKVGV